MLNAHVYVPYVLCIDLLTFESYNSITPQVLIDPVRRMVGSYVLLVVNLVGFFHLKWNLVAHIALHIQYLNVLL